MKLCVGLANTRSAFPLADKRPNMVGHELKKWVPVLPCHRRIRDCQRAILPAQI